MSFRRGLLFQQFQKPVLLMMAVGSILLILPFLCIAFIISIAMNWIFISGIYNYAEGRPSGPINAELIEASGVKR